MNTPLAKIEQPGDYVYLWDFLKKRSSQPWKNFPFTVYFLIAILLFGGLGIWLETFNYIVLDKKENLENLFTAMAAYYPAIVGASAFHLILWATGTSNKVVSAFSFFMVVFFFFLGLLVRYFFNDQPIVCLISTIILVFLSLWFWIIANAEDGVFKKESIDAPAGGNLERKLKGTTDGFEVD